MGPAPSAPPPSASPVAVVPPPQVTASPVSAPPAAEPPASSASKLPLLVLGAAVLAGGAWWLGRSGDAQDAPTVDAAPTAAAGAPSASASPTTTSFGYALAPVPAGTYMIGSPGSESGRSNDEAQHSVTLTHGFLMGTTEVTQGQYKALMGTNPVVSQTDCNKWGNTSGPADDEPVYCVSWVDAANLANAASAKEGLESCYVVSGENVSWPKLLGCTGYRLPTESEWEVAARGGGSGMYAGGNDLGSVGWFDGNSGGRTHPVGKKSANGYGLYDMSGNVWEWTWDIYNETYPSGSVRDPTGASDGPGRVYRGGSWGSPAGVARAALRGRDFPGGRDDGLGLRLSRTIT